MGSNCPCLSFDDLPADVQLEIECRGGIAGNCKSDHPDFPGEYGSSCVAWENIGTWYDDCHPTGIDAVNHIINIPDICYTLSIHL
jgi:hypothetical protein